MLFDRSPRDECSPERMVPVLSTPIIIEGLVLPFGIWTRSCGYYELIALLEDIPAWEHKTSSVWVHIESSVLVKCEV